MGPSAAAARAARGARGQSGSSCRQGGRQLLPGRQRLPPSVGAAT